MIDYDELIVEWQQQQASSQRRLAIDATNWRHVQAIRPAVLTRKSCGGNRTRQALARRHMLVRVDGRSERGVDSGGHSKGGASRHSVRSALDKAFSSEQNRGNLSQNELSVRRRK
jgi:hypothetical protein